MKKVLLLLCIFMFTCLYAQQPGLKDQKAIEESCKAVMEEFLKMNYGKAFSLMEKFSAVNNEDFEKLKNQSVEQSSIVSQNYGQALDYVKIEEKELPGVIKEITYIVRHEKYGLQFQFHLYRGKDDLWRLTNFLWNDELKKLLD